MHELSVALEVCRLTEAHVGTGGAAAVRVVGVEVGNDAGVEIGNLRFCLDALLAEPPFAGAHPVIVRRTGDDLRLAFVEVDDGRSDD